MDTEQAVEELATIKDFVRWGYSQMSRAEVFYGHGTDNGLDESFALVIKALDLPYDLPAAYMDTRLTRNERIKVAEWVKCRVEERVPTPYLTHEAWFANLPFYVDERVLIPRSPVAELINAGFSPWLDHTPVERILDLCTGSGCIAIACAYAFPDIEVDAVDISPDALEVAEKNIEQHGLRGRVHAIESDLFDGLEGKVYDLIISNPPYVSRPEMEALPQEYHHEPELGLAAGEDGLDIVHHILAEAPKYLSEQGILIVEVGISQDALVEAYPDVPFLWLEFEHGGQGVFLLTGEQVHNLG